MPIRLVGFYRTQQVKGWRSRDGMIAPAKGSVDSSLRLRGADNDPAFLDQNVAPRRTHHGIWGAVFADLMILKGAVLKPVRRQTVAMARTLSHFVFAGLGILWISGIVLVGIRVNIDPLILMNEKLWAKIIIVAILTINGIVVHRVALAHLAQCEGQRLFHPNRQGEIAKLTFIGAVSSVSWVVPFILGVATEFNFTVDVVEILGCYVWLVIVAWTLMFLLASSLLEEEQQSHSKDNQSDLTTRNLAPYRSHIDATGGYGEHLPRGPKPRIGSNLHLMTLSKHDLGDEFIWGTKIN